MKTGALIIILVIATILALTLLYLVSRWLGVGKKKAKKQKKQKRAASVAQLPRTAAIAIVQKKTAALHRQLPRRFTGLIILMAGGYRRGETHYVAAIKDLVRS